MSSCRCIHCTTEPLLSEDKTFELLASIGNRGETSSESSWKVSARSCHNPISPGYLQRSTLVCITCERAVVQTSSMCLHAYILWLCHATRHTKTYPRRYPLGFALISMLYQTRRVKYDWCLSEEKLSSLRPINYPTKSNQALLQFLPLQHFASGDEAYTFCLSWCDPLCFCGSPVPVCVQQSRKGEALKL